MIYKEITLGQALEMVNKGETEDLFYLGANGQDLFRIEGKNLYLQHLKNFKFFRRIPKEEELNEK